MVAPQRIIYFWFLAYLSWVIMVKAQMDTERLGGSQKGSRILKVSPAAGRGMGLTGKDSVLVTGELTCLPIWDHHPDGIKSGNTV